MILQLLLINLIIMSIFSHIISWDIPCTKVYEDELCLAFLDINPVSKGHTLLVPKDEHVWMTDTPDELISYLYTKAKEIMQQMKSNLWCDFVRLYVEGTEVPHFHIHLIPSWEGDWVVQLSRSEYAEWEADTIAKKIMWE